MKTRQTYRETSKKREGFCNNFWNILKDMAEQKKIVDDFQ